MPKRKAEETSTDPAPAACEEVPAWLSPRGAGGGLGDVMGVSRLGSSRSVEASSFTPLQRVVLSANGNLQRLVSSYHDSPVVVRTRYNRQVKPGHYERQVDLIVHDTIFARATSKVLVRREDCVHALEHGGVAIGQLFRRFNILPAFEFGGAGGSPSTTADRGHRDGESQDSTDDFATGVGKFWRVYTLSGEGVECRIHEELRCDLFDLPTPPPSPGPSAAPASAAAASAVAAVPAELVLPPNGPSLGDIMSSCATFTRLPAGFTPRQRLLLTANGNVERIVSSYYGLPAELHVVRNERRSDGVVDREVALTLHGRQLMLAKSTCFLTDPEWQQVAESEGLPIGALFRRFNVLPCFTLHAAGHVQGGFWRQYELKAPGLTCQINETFDSRCLDPDRAMDGAADMGSNGAVCYGSI